MTDDEISALRSQIDQSEYRRSVDNDKVLRLLNELTEARDEVARLSAVSTPKHTAMTYENGREAGARDMRSRAEAVAGSCTVEGNHWRRDIAYAIRALPLTGDDA